MTDECIKAVDQLKTAICKADINKIQELMTHSNLLGSFNPVIYAFQHTNNAVVLEQVCEQWVKSNDPFQLTDQVIMTLNIKQRVTLNVLFCAVKYFDIEFSHIPRGNKIWRLIHFLLEFNFDINTEFNLDDLFKLCVQVTIGGDTVYPLCEKSDIDARNEFFDVALEFVDKMSNEFAYVVFEDCTLTHTYDIKTQLVNIIKLIAKATTLMEHFPHDFMEVEYEHPTTIRHTTAAAIRAIYWMFAPEDYAIAINKLPRILQDYSPYTLNTRFGFIDYLNWGLSFEAATLITALINGGMHFNLRKLERLRSGFEKLQQNRICNFNWSAAYHVRSKLDMLNLMTTYTEMPQFPVKFDMCFVDLMNVRDTSKLTDYMQILATFEPTTQNNTGYKWIDDTFLTHEKQTWEFNQTIFEHIANRSGEDLHDFIVDKSNKRLVMAIYRFIFYGFRKCSSSPTTPIVIKALNALGDVLCSYNWLTGYKSTGMLQNMSILRNDFMVSMRRWEYRNRMPAVLLEPLKRIAYGWHCTDEVEFLNSFEPDPPRNVGFGWCDWFGSSNASKPMFYSPTSRLPAKEYDLTNPKPTKTKSTKTKHTKKNKQPTKSKQTHNIYAVMLRRKKRT
jgi:hypothetical protein